MGILSSIGKEIKRGLSKANREMKRERNDLVKFGTLGLIDPQQIKKARAEEKRAAREAKKIQTRQMRESLLEGAELQNELALRSNVARRGGRGGLLTGRDGSLLA